MKSNVLAPAALLAITIGMFAPVSGEAAPLPTNLATMKSMSDPDVVQVRWGGGYRGGGLGYRGNGLGYRAGLGYRGGGLGRRGFGGRGYGYGYRAGWGGVAAGAIVGGAIARRAYYGYGGYGYSPYSYGYGGGYAPVAYPYYGDDYGYDNCSPRGGYYATSYRDYYGW